MLLLALVAALAAGCGGQSRSVEVPSNHRHQLDDALRRLRAVGLRVSFDPVSVPCGNGLPSVEVQSPRAPTRVRPDAVVTVSFQPSLIPMAGWPTRHPRWTYVPALVGKEASAALAELHEIWPCVHVRGATATSASRLVVVKQTPVAGTRCTRTVSLTGRACVPPPLSSTSRLSEEVSPCFRRQAVVRPVFSFAARHARRDGDGTR